MFFPHIFHNLLNFSYQRRGLEIVGFYIAYLVISIMLGAIMGTLISYIAGSSDVRINWNIDLLTASILFLLLSHFLIKKKQLGGGIIYWLIPLAAAALTIYTSHIIGLIIPTILSAKPNKASIPPKPPVTPVPEEPQRLPN